MLYTRKGDHGGYDGPMFEVPPNIPGKIVGPSLFRQDLKTEFKDNVWRVFNDRVSVTDADGWRAYLRACSADAQHEGKAGA